MRGQLSLGGAPRRLDRSPSTFSKLAVPDSEAKVRSPAAHPYADEEVDEKIRAFR